jgi:anti-sigma regulatory factor (Ser/Thr protein kinase)
MPQPDEITLTLPQEREFHRVAHLVLGGLALRLELTIETLEDLQLALSAILDRAKGDGEVTVSMSLHDGMLETSVGPVDLSNELAGDEDDQTLSLRRILWTVVDDVQVEGDHVRLVKRVARNG